MANIIRRDPFNELDRQISSLRRSMNRLFNELMDWTESVIPYGEKGTAFGDVRVDVMERDNDILIKADVPGLDEKNLDIEVTENDVTISGKYEEETKDEGKGYIVHERRSGAFSRTVPINVDIVPEQAKATFKNGVLEITIPKAESAKRKAVKVKINK
ncbi:MAG: hypothetical protein PWP48_1598 [Clostridiales bacterium]|nr:hypothetical protein [Clostridiales bacterium]MDK2992365.1 hypothetical protein [Clostridiales bacterium]